MVDTDIWEADLFFGLSQGGEALIRIGRIDGPTREHHRSTHESQLERTYRQQHLQAPRGVAEDRQGRRPSGFR